jgi:drug/metabolite transporter (DMT)-like permease
MRRPIMDLGLICVVLVWGFSPTVFTIVLGVMRPLAFVLVRFVILSLVSLVILAVHGRRGQKAWKIRRQDVLWLVVSGLCGYGIYQLLYMVGLSHTTAFSSALLMATVPLFTALVLALTRLERIAGLQWAGIAIAFVGIAVFLWLAHASGANGAEIGTHRLATGEIVAGDLMTLVAAVLFAIYGIVNARLAKHYAPPELMCYTLIVGTLAITPFSLPSFFAQNWHLMTWQIWLMIAYSVFFPIYITYSIWNWAIGLRGASYVTLYNFPVPVMAGVFAWILLGQALLPGQIVAAALVLGGMILARYAISRRMRREAIAPAHTPAMPAPLAHE